MNSFCKWCLDDKVVINQPQILLKNPSSCLQHHLNLMFVCLDKKCQQKSLLCAECLPQHRQHNWVNLSHFFTQQVRNMLKDQVSQLGIQLNSTKINIFKNFQSFYKQILTTIQTIENDLKIKIKLLEQKYPQKMKYNISGSYITIQHIIKIQQILRNEKEKQWILQLQNKINKKTNNYKQKILELLKNLKKQYNQNIIIQKQNIKIILKNQQQQQQQSYNLIHQSQQQNIFNYTNKNNNNKLNLIQQQQQQQQNRINNKTIFKFDQNKYHCNILLSNDKLEIIYYKQQPILPVALINKSLTINNNCIKYRIIKLNSKAFFFTASVIYLGVCVSKNAKIKNYRKLTQSGSHSYFISSSGKSYHHSLSRYDAKDTVGWTFTTDDLIQMSIDEKNSQIIFIKNPNTYFPRTFKMELSKDKHEQLTPCVSFSGDTGSKVMIVNQ